MTLSLEKLAPSIASNLQTLNDRHKTGEILMFNRYIIDSRVIQPVAFILPLMDSSCFIYSSFLCRLRHI